MEKRNILLKLATEKLAKATGVDLDRANDMVRLFFISFMDGLARGF